MSVRSVLLLSLAFVLGCRSTDAVDEPPPARIYRLDRAGFVQELVFAQGTPRTVRFDDYTEGSYHVDKLDLLEGIRERRRAGTPIAALIVRGPVGPMWAYAAVLFIREDGLIRVNTVWMPHARITQKSTITITEQAFDELMQVLVNTEAMTRGIPTEAGSTTGLTGNPTQDLEWSYDVLAAHWREDREEVFHTTELHTFATPPPSLVKLHDALDAITGDALVTYGADISEEESIYHSLEP